MVDLLNATDRPTRIELPTQHDRFAPAYNEIITLHRMGLWVMPAHGVIFDWPEQGDWRCTCKHCDPNSTSAGKHPRLKWNSLEKRLYPNDLYYWCNRGNFVGTPVNWCVHLGNSGLMVLDVDVRHGGNDSFAKLIAEHGPLPETVMDVSGGGGRRPWFIQPSFGEIPNLAKIDLAPGVELLGHKHFATIAPSVHYTGKTYRWEADAAPWQTDFAPMPEWLIDLAWQKSGQPRPDTPERTEWERRRNGSGGGPGGRANSNTPLDKILDRAAKYLSHLPPAIQGQNGSRHFYRAACILVVEFDLSPNEARPLLVDYSQRCQPPWSDREIEHALNRANGEGGPRGELLEPKAFTSQRDPEWLAEIAGLENVTINLFDGVPVRRRKDGSNAVIGDDGASLHPTYQQPIGPLFTDEEVERLARECGKDKAKQEEEAQAASRLSDSFIKPIAPKCHMKIFCTHRKTAKARVLLVSCKRWSCSECCKELKHEWKVNVRTRLFGEPELYIWNLSPEEKVRDLARIRRAAGSYFCVVDGDGLLIVSTIGAGTGAQIIKDEDAIAVMAKAIDAIPLCRKPISSSRSWRLIQDDTKTREWEFKGVVPSSTTTQDIRDVLQEHGLKAKEMPRGGTSKLRYVIEFSYPATWDEVKLGAIYGDLCEGKAVSLFYDTFTIGIEPDSAPVFFTPLELV